MYERFRLGMVSCGPRLPSERRDLGRTDGQVSARRVSEPLRRGSGADRTRMGCRRADCMSRWTCVYRCRLVGEFGMVRLQYTAYGLEMLVRDNDLRSPTGSALPHPRRRSSFPVGRGPAAGGKLGRRLNRAAEKSSRSDIRVVIPTPPPRSNRANTRAQRPGFEDFSHLANLDETQRWAGALVAGFNKWRGHATCVARDRIEPPLPQLS
jgi:hypothetical protein